MPLLLALALVVVALLLSIALMPIALVQRYRVGTSRRPARGWVIGLNLFGLSISTALLLTGAAVSTFWIPGALSYAAAGLALGGGLGLLGLAVTRWERSPGALYYTPNRTLVLGITLIVSARVLYGFWRGWQTWRAGIEGTSLLVTAGAAESLGAGALVLGYYLVFWNGVRVVARRSTTRG